MNRLIFLLWALAWLGAAGTAWAVGQTRYVEEFPSPGSFRLAGDNLVATIYIDAQDHAGVVRAVNDLCTDVARVTGLTTRVTRGAGNFETNAIFVGTVGRSQLIDRLVREGRLDTSPIAGKWESFLIQVLTNPLPGVASALVIAGSDKRGTIYGIYDLSEQMGVSPWYFWADVPVRHRAAVHVKAGRYVQGPPAVKYRGIFLNDEQPALGGWAREKYGGFNHAFYTNVFELLLRLKANFLWPAMWDNSFATDDPLNAKLADEYGIVMSTSHHEPMMRAWKEWERAGNHKGSWDYSKNEDRLRAFWAEGLRRTKDYEKVITLGMRGDGDEPMTERESVALLERIVSDQRRMISEMIDTNVATVPQVWALYKEVQGYYERGLRVPDDVTLLWCDDNWGNLRRLPTPEERKRSGGAGIYYHFDYVGGPRNYKWLNTVPIPRIWEQMNLAYRHEANRIWIANVGDLKPLEFPTEFFLTLAWNPERWTQSDLDTYARLWAEREFGPEHATDIAGIMAKYTKYNDRRKPELLEPGTFSLVNYREADTVVSDWQAITEQAERLSRALPSAERDAFFELVLYPTKASAIVTELYVAAARNRLYAVQGRASANDFAARARELFQADANLSAYYNQTLAGGKWNHMMDQTHIGYTGWQQPPSNTMPTITELALPAAAAMGVAVEGSTEAWPGATNAPTLPVFDAFNQPRHYIDVFNKGRGSLEVTATASDPWIIPEPVAGRVEKDLRTQVSIDWTKVPKGARTGSVTLTAGGGQRVTVRVTAFNPETPTRQSVDGFVETDGHVSMQADHFSSKRDTATAHWERLPDHGRTGSAMTIFPVTAPSVVPPRDSPCLEYRMHLFSAGAAEITLLLSPGLNYAPDRGVDIAVSFDEDALRILTVVPKGYIAGDGNRDWEESVKDNIRRVKSSHEISRPGSHTLKVWMVDPGVVLQSIEVDFGGIRPSYLGPPESYRRPTVAGS